MLNSPQEDVQNEPARSVNVHPEVVARLEAKERDDYMVPHDFPKPSVKVRGMQPLFSMIAFEGRYYPPGCTPPALYERWETLEELAQGLSKQLLNHGVNKYPEKTKEEILSIYLHRLLGSLEGSDDELRWAIRRAAQLSDCAAPPDAAASQPSPRTLL